MKENMQIVALLCLFLCCMQTAGSEKDYPLDKAPLSVDDMYNGCKEEMKKKVETEYLENEKNKDNQFKQVWEEAENTYNRKFKKTNPRLGKERIMAIYVYSFGKGDFYKDINNAVRSQRSEYGKAFKYHALHFFLTDAIQILRKKCDNNECLTVYRGVDVKFDQNVLNKEIRFGSFASATLAGYKVAKKFGDKSCFEIVTCFGADISLYSKFGEAEAEVLIPPYELFKVTDIKKKSDEKSLECEVVYKVESTRETLSNLNCALFPK